MYNSWSIPELLTASVVESFLASYQLGAQCVSHESETKSGLRALCISQSVYLLVLEGVQGETLWGGNPARATTLMSESERQGNRQSSGQLPSSDA